jgi:hypothetical protein
MRFPYSYWWAAGITLIVLGVLDSVVRGWQDVATSGLITSGIIVIIIMLGKGIRMENGPRQDERTKKNGAWGLSYSWFLTFVTLFLLFLDTIPGTVDSVCSAGNPSPGAGNGHLRKVFQWYFFREGDVE